ncbi:MAG: hypothetical protein RLY93_01785 [Sumerlaeia bacterium]
MNDLLNNRRAAGVSLLLAVTLCVPAAMAGTTNPRLHGDLPSGSEAEGVLPLANSSEAVVFGDLETFDLNSLFRVPMDGSAAPVNLIGSLPPTADTRGSFQLSPDGSRIAFEADIDTDGVFELYTVPADLSSAPVRINPDFSVVDSLLTNFQFSPDSQLIGYVADQRFFEVFELFVAPADGSSVPVRVTNDFPVSGDVEDEFLFTPDSSTVIYTGDQDVNGDREIYSVPADGSSSPTQLNNALPTGGDVDNGGVLISADGGTVFFTGDARVNGFFELFAAPVDGSSAAVLISPAMTSTTGVSEGFCALTPDGSRIVYLADADTNGIFEIYSVPTDGSQAATKLNDPLITGGQVIGSLPQITADGSTVVYLADQITDEAIEVFAVPVDGSTTATRLNSPLTAGQNVTNFAISPDGQRVAYRSNENVYASLFSVPIDGSEPPFELTPPQAGTGVVRFAYDDDAETIVYIARQNSGNREAFSVTGTPDVLALPATLVVEAASPFMESVTFGVDDHETSPAGLLVSASSLNTALVQNGNLTLSGSATTRTLDLTYEQAVGSAEIVVSVTDALGNVTTASVVLTVQDTTSPTVTLLTANDITTAGGSDQSIVVRYTDIVALAAPTINDSNIRVTGPNGYDEAGQFTMINLPGNGTPRDVTYTVPAPGGSWQTLDSGTYTISFLGGSVTDTSANSPDSAVLGTFDVTISSSVGDWRGLE